MASGMRVHGVATLTAKLGALVPAAEQAARIELKRSLLNIQNGAKKRVRVDRGGLRNSIAHETSENGLVGRAGTNSEHGPANEFGRRAGAPMPPVSEIRDWAKRKGIKDPDRAAYPIARAIARRGTPAAPFLFPSFEEERPEFLRRLPVAIDNAHRKVARGGGR